ncbi:MAG: hypothetical protein ACYS1A_13575 [Planctomycetota bacterium]|jgi:hypothetical protein
MFKELIENIKKLSRTPVVVDPSRFDDPVATTTSWTPAKSGGANFCTHKLVKVAPHRMEFRASFGAKLFYLIFLLVGIGLVIGFSYKLISQETVILSIDTILPLLIGCVFAIVGGCLLYFGTMPIVFDKNSSHFWKGRRDPDIVFNKDSIKVWTQLEQIHALQLISEYCHSNKSSYYSYELNLVLEDGERINVVDHGKLKKICDDADTLSNFLERPVWNAT